jgi:isoleucyl-tRNA synthetase
MLHDGKALILAEALVGATAHAMGLVEDPADTDAVNKAVELLRDNNGELIRVKGEELVGLTYEHPVHDDMTGVIVTGGHVTLDSGTGAVHTAPGHGQEDYEMGLEYGLPMLMPVDDNGVFDAGGGPFEGLNVDDANPVIIDWLRERGTLMAHVDITHSYPHCWRCHEPVIFRATDQWFVSMDDTGLREKALAAIEKIKWYPDWAVRRMQAMVGDRPDWCISRQRSWGVPIPVFTCKKCHGTVATPETFDAVINLFENEGSDAWFTHDPADYLPADTHCEVCGAGVDELEPEHDILDVWFESGVSHTSVLKQRDYLTYPADLYLEGSDQHRGWFQSSLLTSVGAYGQAPYKGIMSCGFVMDGQGHKMSKSVGNVVDPAKVIDTYGADVLRLWVGSIDYSQDVGIDDEIIKRTSESYRNIRNKFRFLLSNLYDFDKNADAVAWDDMLALDRWAIVRLQHMMSEVTDAYDAMHFHAAYHVISDYMNELSSVYLDVLKDRLYSDGAKSVARRSAQTALSSILEVLVRELAPILAFTCDEVWCDYPEGMCEDGRAEAVQLAGWPSVDDFAVQVPAGAAEQIERDFEVILNVRDAVTKALEDARGNDVIGKSQEAAITITAQQDVASVLQAQDAGMLEELFIVASVNAVSAAGETGSETSGANSDEGDIHVDINVASGDKCPRCWNIRELGSDPSHPDVCARCAAVLTSFRA